MVVLMVLKDPTSDRVDQLLSCYRRTSRQTCAFSPSLLVEVNFPNLELVSVLDRLFEERVDLVIKTKIASMDRDTSEATVRT